MKTRLFILLLFGCSIGYGQRTTISLDTTTGKYKCSDILRFDSIKAGEMFAAVQVFIPKAFDKWKVLPVSADKDAGIQVYRTFFDAGWDMDAHWNITLEYKDNKMRYTFSEFRIEYNNKAIRMAYGSKDGSKTPLEHDPMPNKNKIIEKINRHLEAFVGVVGDHVRKVEKEGDEW